MQTDPGKFFSKEQEQEIIAAISQAETATSGEIRLHLIKRFKGEPMDEAKKIFFALGMQKTKLRNGCIIVVALESKRVVVLGDKGINELLGQGFWQDVIVTLIERFKKEEYVQGLVEAIVQIGDKLKKYFPYQKHDVNELSNDLSFG